MRDEHAVGSKQAKGDIESMSVTLTDQDLVELQALLGDFRHKEAAVLIQFFQKKKMESARRAVSRPVESELAANGHDSNPYQAQA